MKKVLHDLSAIQNRDIPFSKAADLIQISPVIHNRIVCPEYIVEISIYPPDGIQVEKFSIKDRNKDRSFC